MLNEKLLFKLNLLYEKLKDDLMPSPMDFKMDSNNIVGKKQIFYELFPNLSSDEIRNLLLLLKLVCERSKENLHKVEIVSSGISNLNLPVRETIGVIRQLLFDSSQNIFMTGYAISSYFHQVADILRYKSTQGITIEIFIENTHNENLKHLIDYLNIENLKIYKYNNPSRNSSLHAKTIVVDNQIAFITSANLSYNGMINNIEIGALIEGKQVKKIVKIFEELKNRGFFESIN